MQVHEAARTTVNTDVPMVTNIELTRARQIREPLTMVAAPLVTKLSVMAIPTMFVRTARGAFSVIASGRKVVIPANDATPLMPKATASTIKNDSDGGGIVVSISRSCTIAARMNQVSTSTVLPVMAILRGLNRSEPSVKTTVPKKMQPPNIVTVITEV